MQKIAKIVARYYGKEYKELFSKSRKREFVLPRQISAYMIKKNYQHLSFSEIGRFLGISHATVMHGIKVIENEIITDKKRAAEVKEINRELNLKKWVIERADSDLIKREFCNKCVFYGFKKSK